MTADGVWFHEDDYCQKEVQSLANLRWCEEEIRRIDGHSEAHAVDMGRGWVAYSKMYVRADAKVRLSSLGITRSVLAAVMRPLLAETASVYTGSMSGPKELCERTVAFGYLCADWNEERVVENIWCPTGLCDEDVHEISALHALGHRYPLLYVDWGWGFLAPLDGSSTLLDLLIEQRSS